MMDRLKQLVSKHLQMQGPGPHPDADTLSAYAENGLSRAEQQRVLGHVADCKDCREILFLAQPDLTETETIPAYRPARLWHFGFRWGAVAASLVIVAGGVFLTRQEFFRAQHKSAQAPVTQYYDKVASDKMPADLDSRRIAEPALPIPAAKENTRTDLALATAPKRRPQEKHMTAKLQSPLRFDNSDQVQMAPSANARPELDRRAANAPVQGQNAAAPFPADTDESAPAPQALAKEQAPAQTPIKTKDAGAFSNAAGIKSAPGSVATGNLVGTVRDPSGSVVANTQVTVNGPVGEQTVTSDEAGKFSFDQLTPGSYSLKARASGFKITTAEVAVLEHKTTDLPVKLEIGSTSGPVMVVSASPEVESTPEEAKVAGALLSANALPPPQTTAEVVARDQKSAKDGRKKAAAEVGTGSAGKTTPQAQWTISADGTVQRSFDSGKSWQSIAVGNASGLRAIFAAGSEVWVGGKAGTLYHSSDAGQAWKQVTASGNGEKLTADVTRIEFSDGSNGSISAANGEIWLTSDGGQTWRKK